MTCDEFGKTDESSPNVKALIYHYPPRFKPPPNFLCNLYIYIIFINLNHDIAEGLKSRFEGVILAKSILPH